MKITAVEAVPLSIPFKYGAQGWKLGILTNWGHCRYIAIVADLL